jgi:alkylhydroperoxidase family enzyme
MVPEGERLNQIERDEITHPGLLEVVENAERSKAPPAAWYLTMGNNPEVAAAFARYWETVFRSGTVEHEIKEICRIQIAQMIGCEFCARQRSPRAESITDDEIHSCALPDWEHPDPKTRAALHYARTITLDDGRDDEVYAQVREHYTDAEIVEMGAFFTLTGGGNRLAHSWGVEAGGEATIPDGVMSIHDLVPVSA